MTKQTPLWMAAIAAVALVTPAAAQETASDQVVATVNGTDITLGEMALTKSQLPQQYQTLPPEVLFDGILQQLIQQTVLGQSVKDVSKKTAADLANKKRTVLATAAIENIIQQPITDEALKAAYAKKYEGADPKVEYNASHILVDSKEKAMEVKKQLDSGADFAATAREKSTGPSGPNGGELNWFGEGQMVKPFEKAVAGLKVGEISEPVKTQFGWHIIRLNDKRKVDIPAFDKVRDQLRADLQKEMLDAKIAELVSAADVTRAKKGTIDPALLSSDTLFTK